MSLRRVAAAVLLCVALHAHAATLRLASAFDPQSFAPPDAVLPEKLQYVAIMSGAWCEKHDVQRAQDFKGQPETFAVRNANGTGPFRLERCEADARTTLRRHGAWWGWKETSDGQQRHGNLTEVQFVCSTRRTRTSPASRPNPRLTLAQTGDFGQQ